jgi:uncharacterized protein (DUF1501 family)
MDRPNTFGGNTHRRAFLQIGSAGLLGLTLPNFLWLEAQSKERPADGKRARGVILIFLDGGPSTIDMWDMKPDAQAEVRGEFRPAATVVPGMQICEHLPKLARVMDRVTLIRSLHHVINDHFVGSRYVLAGRLPARGAEPPALASLAAALLPSAPGMPPAFTLVDGYDFGLSQAGAGRLGAAYGSMKLDLGSDHDRRSLEGLTLPDCFPISELDDRERLRRRLDRRFAALDRSGLPGRLDRFQQEALDVLRSDKVRKALDVESEPVSVRKTYGLLDRNLFFQDSTAIAKALLVARRLIEVGARFVTVGARYDWDTHNNQFPKLRNALLPTLDRGLPALIADLDERGLLGETVVYCVGEFGRTPRINGQGGRDHWPQAMAALLAGGGFRRGYVHGATDRHGAAPASDPCTPEDIAATIFDRLGFLPSHRLATLRDTSIFPDGRVLRPLVGA